MATQQEIADYIKSIKTASVHWYNSYNPINNNAVQLIPNKAFGLVFALHISKTSAPKIKPII